ncbi:hypothetical protein [Microlunatus flavus]|uniref:Uncharacterized protein n=1 Tax=Microlunatus flavus TaxID=1036181 RepID=A0A1H9KGL2_9ACTN|nr:hypothetical protein [Microlunatus flavus]SEQ98294.1 hypothetical protein SAMN05421756_107211 [Microlunatus flavus]
MMYEAFVTREGRWWMVQVPSIDAVTQARHVAEVPLMARELVAVHEGLKLEDVEVTITYGDISGVPGDRVTTLLFDREVSDRINRNVAERTSRLARDLVSAEVPLREVAELIGVSHQRVHQLVTTAVPTTEGVSSELPEEPEAEVVDLVAALRKSVEDARGRREADLVAGGSASAERVPGKGLAGRA